MIALLLVECKVKTPKFRLSPLLTAFLDSSWQNTKIRATPSPHGLDTCPRVSVLFPFLTFSSSVLVLLSFVLPFQSHQPLSFAVCSASASAVLPAGSCPSEVMCDAVAHDAGEKSAIGKDTEDDGENERDAKDEDERPGKCRYQPSQL